MACVRPSGFRRDRGKPAYNWRSNPDGAGRSGGFPSLHRDPWQPTSACRGAQIIISPDFSAFFRRTRYLLYEKSTGLSTESVDSSWRHNANSVAQGRKPKMNLSEALLHALREHGAREIFGIPGDYALPFFKV